MQQEVKGLYKTSHHKMMRPLPPVSRQVMDIEAPQAVTARVMLPPQLKDVKKLNFRDI